MKSFIDWVQSIAIALGAPGLFLIGFLDSSFLSFPEVNDLLLVLMVTEHPQRMLVYATSATLGSLAGCLALYYVGRKGGDAFIRRRFSAGAVEKTLERTLNGHIRLQDAPAIVSAVMGNVYGKELGWDFVKTHWDRMDREFPKQGLRRMCGGITALATPALEADVRAFFSSRKIDLGGKTLEQYLEQLRITVNFKERHETALTDYLGVASQPAAS